MAQKYVAFVIHLASTVVLARLLTPHDTGIFSLAAAAVAIGHLLRDFGVSDYVITQRDLTNDKLRAAFTLTVLMAWTIAGVLLLLAYPLAAFYSEPQLVVVLQLLCGNFLLLPFGSIAFALLSKQMRFGLIFAAQTSAAVLGVAVTIWAAWAGYGAASLALGSLLANAWTIVFLLLLQRGSVFMRPTLHGLSGVLRFGGSLTVSRLIEQGANRSSDFIVAGMLGFHSAGLLSKSNSLIGSFHEFFNAAVLRVATPMLSQVGADSVEQHARYLQATVMVATALWLFFPFLGIFAHEIVLLLFGPAWLECVPVVQISCVGALFWAPFMLSSSLLTARGAVGEQMRIQLVASPFFVAALVVGAQYDLVALAIATNAGMSVRFFMIGRARRRCCGISLWAVIRALLPSAGVGTAALIGTLASKLITASIGLPVIVQLIGSGALGLAAAAFVARFLGHPVFKELIRLVRQLRGAAAS